MAKRKTRKGAKRRRTAAQRAATARMLAAARRARKGVRLKVRKVRRKARRASSAATAFLSRVKGAPMARKKKARRKGARRRFSRRGSSGGRRGFVSSDLLGSVAATAGGLVGVSLAVDRLPLPANLKTGNGRIAAKAGVGLALAMFGGKVLPRGIARGLAVGALASAALDVAKKGGLSGFNEGDMLSLDGMGNFSALPGGDGSGAFDVVDATSTFG